MPRIVDRDVKRAEFVAASLEVIAASGLNATTLRRVAAQAGCTTGALTHYFPDRSTLLITALRSVQAAAGRRMIAVAKATPDPVVRLQQTVMEALPLDDVRVREWRVWLAFWGASPGHPLLIHEHSSRYDEWRALLNTVLTPLCPDPRAREAELDSLMALIDGLGVRGALAHGPDDHVHAERRSIAGTVNSHIDRLVVRCRGGRV